MHEILDIYKQLKCYKTVENETKNFSNDDLFKLNLIYETFLSLYLY